MRAQGTSYWRLLTVKGGAEFECSCSRDRRAKVGKQRKEDDQGWNTSSLQPNRAKKMSSAVNVQLSRAQLSDGRSLRKRVCPYVAQWFTVTQFTVKILELVS